MHAWEVALTDDDRAVIERGGYGRRRGFDSAPALVLIDCQYNHIGADKPILDQLDDWPAGGGRDAWDAVRRIEPVLERARALGIPVIFTRYCYSRRSARFDAFSRKRGRNLDAFLDGAPGTEIVEPLAPRDDELVVDKVHASAFYATALLSYLQSMRIDTLLVGGVSTSGCVRATVVDAVSNNFNAGVLEDCVADRLALSHRASLLDLWMKYADVVDSHEALDYMSALGRTRDEEAGVGTV